jgi:hypothetical protein
VQAFRNQLAISGLGPFLFIFKKYSQMKLQMKREALEKINRRANEMSLNQGMDSGTAMIQ